MTTENPDVYEVLQRMWADAFAEPAAPTDLADTASFVRNMFPYGPAPEGWHTVKHCSHNIPHNWDDEERNAQLNEDHYEALSDYNYEFTD